MLFLNLFYKKNFYDGWDNVIYFFVPNLILDALVIICTAIASLGVTVFKDADFFLYIWILLAFILVCGASILTLAWAELAKDIADYGAVNMKDFFSNIKSCISDGIKYALALCLVTIACTTGIIYFLKPQDGNISFAGMLTGICYIWCGIIVFMAITWYPSLRAQMHNPFLKSIKKCFIILFDNVAVTVSVSIYSLFLTAISIIMLGLAPGMAGLELARANAIRLILKKYDYIEELDKSGEPMNSKARRKIPWKDILKDDIEANPTRGFKAFVFPWKDK